VTPRIRFRLALSTLLLGFFIAGGYVGYLSALVDQDELIFIEQVRALTDRERLEKQLARSKSILEARRRAYLRRSQEFLLSQGITPPPVVEEDEQHTDSQTVVIYDDLIEQVNVSTVSQPQRETFAMLEEEREDLTFFEDEVETIEQILEREPDPEELEYLLAGKTDRRQLSDGLRELLRLLDKRNELVQQRSAVRDGYQYWESNPESAPDGVFITVHNKGDIARDLNPIHVTQVSAALSIMPPDFDRRLNNLYVVYGDPKMRRGMSGVGVVFMKGEELDFFRVLVHEFAHIYDLHREVTTGDKSEFYDGSFRLYAADPSVEYYSYSWNNTYDRAAKQPSFASQYGMSDPFEDYAEAFALYVLQGDTFARWQQEDSILAQKYDFFREIYDGRTFPSQENYYTRPYDVTLLYVNYEQLLLSSSS